METTLQQKIQEYSMKYFNDLADLALLHKTNKNLREKIEYILTDCNFHSECSDFSSGLYQTYIRHI